MLKDLRSEIFKEKIPLHNSYFSRRVEILHKLYSMINKFKYRTQTYYLVIEYLDFIYSNGFETKIELAVISALLLASKFDENDANIPDLNNYLNAFSGFFFTLDEIRKTEISVMKKLNHKLNQYTPYHFINYYLSEGFVFGDETIYSQTEAKMQKINQLSLKQMNKLYDTVKEILITFVECYYF